MSSRSSTQSQSRIHKQKERKLLERVEECEGNKFNINLIFIILFFYFLYITMGTMFPKTDFSKKSLLSSLDNMVPDFTITKK